MRRIADMPNALKAQTIISINIIFAMLQLFGIDLTVKKQAEILILVNVFLWFWVVLTDKYSLNTRSKYPRGEFKIK